MTALLIFSSWEVNALESSLTYMILLTQTESSLRHLIYSICKLPDTANPKINATINETAPHHLARLVLTALLLTDDSFDPITNAEAVVHLWYSAKLPSTLFNHIELVAAEPLLTAMEDLDKLCADNRISEVNSFPVTMPRRGKSVVIDINRAQWSQIIRFVKISKNTNVDNASIIRGWDCKKYSEPLYRVLRRMTPVRATGMMRWRSDGLLLPYGHPREEFDILNPYDFHSQPIEELLTALDSSSLTTRPILLERLRNPLQSGQWNFSITPAVQPRMMSTARCSTTSEIYALSFRNV